MSVVRSIRFPEDVLEAVERAAETRGSTVNGLLIDILRGWLAARSSIDDEMGRISKAGIQSPYRPHQFRAPKRLGVITGRQLADSMGVQLGPTRSAPGSRLKS